MIVPVKVMNQVPYSLYWSSGVTTSSRTVTDNVAGVQREVVVIQLAIGIVQRDRDGIIPYRGCRRCALTGVDRRDGVKRLQARNCAREGGEDIAIDFGLVIWRESQVAPGNRQRAISWITL